MSNIEKLVDFINERDPEGKVFPAFIAVVEMLIAAGWKPGREEVQ